MAKTTMVSVTYGRKFNLGDYNSAHIEISIWAELEDGDDSDTVTTDLFEQAKGHVRDQALPIIANQKAKVEKVFAGLPESVQNELLKEKGYIDG